MSAGPQIGREILYLSRDDVSAVGVTASEMNDAVAAILRAKAQGAAWAPPKMAVFRPDGASFRAKGGALSRPGYGAVKWFGYFPGNERARLPDFVPLIFLNEGETGMPVAIMDGVVISAQRGGRTIYGSPRSLVGWLHCLWEPSAEQSRGVAGGVFAEARRRLQP
jgi:ornithine cyclodeaminase/alanine dehydrogenase-like protein (mu-crystallin family)